jgi:hypothetical protein
VSGLKYAYRLEQEGVEVFYMLRLIQNDVIETYLLELSDIVSECLVAREKKIILVQLVEGLHAGRPIMQEMAKFRGEPMYLALPVRDGVHRYNDEGCFEPTLLFQFLKKGKYLHGFSETHIICEASSQPVCIEKKKPVIPALLIITEHPVETTRQRMFFYL